MTKKTVRTMIDLVNDGKYPKSDLTILQKMTESMQNYI